MLTAWHSSWFGDKLLEIYGDRQKVIESYKKLLLVYAQWDLKNEVVPRGYNLYCYSHVVWVFHFYNCTVEKLIAWLISTACHTWIILLKTWKYRNKSESWPIKLEGYQLTKTRKKKRSQISKIFSFVVNFFYVTPSVFACWQDQEGY